LESSSWNSAIGSRAGFFALGWTDTSYQHSAAILAIDTAVAQRYAAFHIPDPRSDRDALIAATALVHGMTVVTRNVNHFQSMGIALVNPWQQ
jgi:predicted nucleic acid-binding protein